jgi:hypothetical protein
MGQVIAMTRCPFHGDTDPSLAIYDNGYYCFGCHKSGKLEQWMVDLAHQKPITQSALSTRTQARNLEQYSYVYSTEAKKFFKDRGIRLDIAKEFQCKYYNNTLLVPTYGIEGGESGKQLRYLNRKPKYRLIPKIRYKQKIYPTYSRCLPEVNFAQLGFIVESIYDAMILWQGTSIPSIAILGTNLRTDILMKLFLLSKMNHTTWIIYLDPDAKVITSLMADRMRAYGLTVIEYFSEKKPYEYTDSELEDMINEVIE